MFLRNYWYVAANDTDVQRKPFGRIILGEPIVFYRTEDGTPVAFEDRCAVERSLANGTFGAARIAADDTEVEARCFVRQAF